MNLLHAPLSQLHPALLHDLQVARPDLFAGENNEEGPEVVVAAVADNAASGNIRDEGHIGRMEREDADGTVQVEDASEDEK